MINFYELPEIKKELFIHENHNFNETQIKVPFRMACIATSGAGKTNFLLNLIKLFTQGNGTFTHIHILHKIPEYLYDYLAKKIGDKITFYERLSEMPEAKELENHGGGHQLVIFDDCVTEKKQEKIENYYIYGRKINGGVGCSCIYLSQKYYAIPKIIRGQLSYVILLRIREKLDFRRLLRDCGIPLEIDELESIYKDATSLEQDFLKIDLSTRDENKMLSKKFSSFYDIS